MSPTPPETEQGDCDTSAELYQQNFNRTNGLPVFPGKNEVDTKEITNGDGVVRSAYFHSSETPEKAKRGRPKSVTKSQTANGAIKKRGRPPKVKTDDVPSKQSKITDSLKKAKRTNNRFKDVTKEELMERFLPDRIKHNLDILIIGINPGLFAAYKGHHYAGPGNHFWSCINMSGFVDRKMTADNDIDLLDYGIGFSTIVQRTTPGAKDLSTKEIKEGAKKLIEKIQLYKPRIAVFNGKGIYEIFSKEIFGQKKKDFVFGTQVNKIPDTDTYIYVMPSSSARCAQFPRAQDKVHFYVKLKQLRDEIKGVTADAPICEVGYSFNLEKATELAKIQNIKQERFDPEYESVAPGKASQAAPYSVFSTANCPTTSCAAQNTNCSQANRSDKDKLASKNGPSFINNPEPSGDSKTVGKSEQRKLMEKKAEEDNVTARHAHLVRYLRQDADDSEPGPSNRCKDGVIMPTSLCPGNPKLQEDVSEEQRQERVGNWIREQQSLEYDSDLPMGMERREEAPPRVQEGGLPPGAEIDGASQLSAISAGVSGSASESTSGYGSIDASSRRVRLDRVEMWVLDQQHVLRHNAGNNQPHQHQQVLQSIQSAGHSSQNQIPALLQPQSISNIVTNWQQNLTQTQTAYTVPGSTVAHTSASQALSIATRNAQRVSAAVSNQVSATNDTPGTSGSNADRASPYGFVRTPKREGESGSSHGTSIRPPVPLFSSWGGEASSGGSGISSPLALFNQTTQSSPTQPFIVANTSTTANPSSVTDSLNSILPMTWQTTQGSLNSLAPNYHL